MANSLSWLDEEFTTYLVSDGTTLYPKRSILELTGSGVSVADDPTNDRTVVTFAGGGGGVPSGIGVRFVDAGVETIGPVQLGESSYVNGLLAASNQQPQELTGAVEGTTDDNTLALGANASITGALDASKVAGFAGVTVTGTAAAGKVVVASDASDAVWMTLPIADVGGPGTAGYLKWTGTAWSSEASINLASDVTGTLAVGNQAAQNMGGTSGPVGGTTAANTFNFAAATGLSGTLAALHVGGVANVTVTGVPTSGQVLAATSSTTATWQTISGTTAPTHQQYTPGNGATQDTSQLTSAGSYAIPATLVSYGTTSTAPTGKVIVYTATVIQSDTASGFHQTFRVAFAVAFGAFATDPTILWGLTGTAVASHIATGTCAPDGPDSHFTLTAAIDAGVSGTRAANIQLTAHSTDGADATWTITVALTDMTE